MADSYQSQQTYRGLRRETPLPSCILSRDDLRTLYARLSEKVSESLEGQLALAELPDGFDSAEWEDLKQQARDAGQLTAMVFGSHGEQVYTTEEDGLLDRNLPDRIETLVLDSASALKNAVNVEARNRFKVTIDFSNPRGFNGYDPTTQPTPNASSLEVYGPDETWISGVHDLVLQFFKSRATTRRLVHSGDVFFLVQWLVVFPASIWGSYRLVGFLPADLTGEHPVLTTGLYFYSFFSAFILFRLLKLWVRHAWPYVELEGNSRTLGRVALSTVTGGVAAALIYDVVKHVFT
jgi:hypothetical protein